MNMRKTVMDLLKFILILIYVKSCLSQCVIDIKVDLGEPQPLFLNFRRHQGFLYPRNTAEGNIVLKNGSSVRLACPGSDFSTNNTHSSSNAVVECIRDKVFYFPSSHFQESIHNITCKRHPQHTIRRISKSCGDGSLGIIGFPVSSDENDEFYNLIDFCHDEKLSHTIYAHAKIVAAIGTAQTSVKRPNFIRGNYFHDIAMQQVYSRNRQEARIAKILNSEELARKYIRAGNYFFARGHLIAKTDFIYGSQQRATFYYVNVVPMWQNINAGNWLAIETGVRSYASRKNCDLDIWTGSLGVLKLPDVTGEQREIYLYEDNHGRRVPVPELLFKVVYERKNRSGIVFVTMNNPHIEKLIEDKIICNDVCDKVNYVKWQRNNSEKGVSYCCEIDEFRKTFKYLPSFTTGKLLT